MNAFSAWHMDAPTTVLPLLPLLTALFLAVAAPLMAQPQAAPGAKPSPEGSEGRGPEPIRVLVLPTGETTLASPVAGRLVTLDTELGQSFKKDAVLAAFDCGEAQARLGVARADASAAREQHEAKLRMQGLDQASDVEVALAASAVAKGKSEVELYQYQVKQCTIRAPWDGRTAKLHVRNHMTVAAGQPLLDLVRTGPLRLKLNLPSGWVDRLRSDLPFTVRIDETGKEYPAKVQLINSRVDPVSQTIEIEAVMPQIQADLLPGMSGVARFDGLD